MCDHERALDEDEEEDEEDDDDDEDEATSDDRGVGSVEAAPFDDKDDASGNCCEAICQAF